MEQKHREQTPEQPAQGWGPAAEQPVRRRTAEKEQTRQKRASAAQRPDRERRHPEQRTAQTGKQPAQKPDREQQKKKRVRRMNRSAFRIKLLTMLGVAAAVILGFVIFFKIQQISVAFDFDGAELSEQELQEALAGQENRYYSADEIIAASGIGLGDNLLTLNKAEVAARIKAALPYVSQVQIKRTLPSTVTLIVTEFEVTYAVCDEAGQWWLINCEGRVLEEGRGSDGKEHIQVQGMTVKTPEIGQIIEPAGAEGADETELSAKKSSLIQVLQSLEANSEIAKQIVSVDMSASYDIVLWYGTQYEVHLGTTDELAYKFAYLVSVLENFRKENQTYLSGVIDITFSESRNARFHPFD